MLEKQYYIPEPEEFMAESPLSPELKEMKRRRDEEVKAVVSGRSGKMLMIVGPCSAHESAPVLEYISRLGKLNERVKEKLVLVPRIYTNKPRTKGVGYKGMFIQPDPEGEADIVRGIRSIRALHIAAMKESGLTAADEMLYPENTAYVEDLLSYHAIGARSVENQLHRLVASGIDTPVGMKNPMSGNLPAMINSIFAAQSPQVFKYRNYQVRSAGNPYAHAILRGGVDGAGADVPNFHYETVMRVAELYAGAKLQNPAIIIDCNHSNSAKQCRQQIRIAQEVMQNRRFGSDFKKLVKGFMIESFLVEGSQPTGEVFGKSITDPCLGWEDTQRLILDIAESV
ncbi:MAG: 3-deoxy-7-phosphoheptulonate synthase [Firmicutes bacterium]|jgi:3-deoxy-7-phosphoheptulonate synthase|nr:3-deoxy-7-phosphoheptulonate synthase [Clostridia bacterium]MBS5021783.1 3-deoxy-7-phosphoheptulonate synthase [Bacillota bacterium]